MRWPLKFHWRWLYLATALCAVGCDLSPLFPPAPAPIPDPPVVVDPDGKPIPAGSVAWVYVIEESSARTPAIGDVLTDPWWHSSGIKYRIFDKDSPEAADVVKAVGSMPLPAIVLADASGKLLYRGPLPTSIDGIKKLIGGVK